MLPKRPQRHTEFLEIAEAELGKKSRSNSSSPKTPGGADKSGSYLIEDYVSVADVPLGVELARWHCCTRTAMGAGILSKGDLPHWPFLADYFLRLQCETRGFWREVLGNELKQHNLESQRCGKKGGEPLCTTTGEETKHYRAAPVASVAPPAPPKAPRAPPAPPVQSVA